MTNYQDKISTLMLKRPERNCSSIDLSTQKVNLGMLILIIVLGIVLFLLFLGLLKAVCGLLCSPCVGMFGMKVLVDLPRPLEKYQETELVDMKVLYDVAGWPIHPQTGKRTVRALSRY